MLIQRTELKITYCPKIQSRVGKAKIIKTVKYADIINEVPD